MQETMVPPGLRQYEHFNLKPMRALWTEEGETVPRYLPIERCVTPRGEPLCSCGRLLLVWVEPLNTLDNRA